MSALLITGLGSGQFARRDLEALSRAVDGAVPVSSILDRTAIDPDARFCSVISRDGRYSASIPLDELRAGGRLAVNVPPADGGPVRLTVVDGTTLCWNVKDVGELRFTADPEPDSVPEKPTH